MKDNFNVQCVLKLLRSNLKGFLPTGIVLLISTGGISAYYFYQPQIMRRITDEGLMTNHVRLVVEWSCVWLCLGIAINLIRVLQKYLTLQLEGKFKKIILSNILAKLERISMGGFFDTSSVSMASRLLNDVDILAGLFEVVVVDYLFILFQIIGGLIGLWQLNNKLSFLILTVIPIKIICTRWFSRKKKTTMREFIESENNKITSLEDILSGMREIKIWDCMNVISAPFYMSLEKNIQLKQKLGVLDGGRDGVEDSIDLLLNCLLYIIAGYYMVKAEFTIGTILAYMSYASYILSPVRQLITIPYVLSGVLPSIDRLQEFLKYEEENQEYEIPVSSEDRENEGVAEPLTDDYPVIELRNISFGYSSDQDIFKDMNLKINRFDIVGLIGENGSGKSTLVDLILGFVLPTGGDVLFENIPYSKGEIKELRKKISCMSQNSHLFNNSIRANIDLKKMSHIRDIEEIVRSVGIDISKMTLEDAIENYIKNGKERFSGGEFQKIILARCFLKDAEVMIFDEATRGLDRASCEKFKELISNYKGKKTIIIISHNMEDLLHCTKLYKIKDKKLVAILKGNT